MKLEEINRALDDHCAYDFETDTKLADKIQELVKDKKFYVVTLEQHLTSKDDSLAQTVESKKFTRCELCAWTLEDGEYINKEVHFLDEKYKIIIHCETETKGRHSFLNVMDYILNEKVFDVNTYEHYDHLVVRTTGTGLKECLKCASNTMKEFIASVTSRTEQSLKMRKKELAQNEKRLNVLKKISSNM